MCAVHVAGDSRGECEAWGSHLDLQGGANGGPLQGPHLPTTTAMKALAVTNASRAFWRGDTSKDGLQRVYGIAFTDKKVLHHSTPTKRPATGSLRKIYPVEHDAWSQPICRHRVGAGLQP